MQSVICSLQSANVRHRLAILLNAMQNPVTFKSPCEQILFYRFFELRRQKKAYAPQEKGSICRVLSSEHKGQLAVE